MLPIPTDALWRLGLKRTGVRPRLRRVEIVTTQAARSRLDSIVLPADLRRLPEDELQPLADELREYLIDTIARSGGHLAAGLGTVELTVGLHYVFDTPRDSLVWDVGHQAYPHKALTGRRERMHTLRRRNGLSGFLRRDESPYDAFGAGHSSTSISAALGLAVGPASVSVVRRSRWRSSATAP